MAGKPVLLDRWGNPVRRAALRTEIAAATTTGIRNPVSGYPADGLNPQRLASILRAADAGDPVRYLELAETIEERDPHYLGILGTRRRSVSQLDITVEPGGDSQFDLDRAEDVRKWLKRDELSDELFDTLDAIGKGYSLTEISWDSSSGDHEPERLTLRDPRWFRFDKRDLTTPVILKAGGQEEPLPAFRFVYARMAAKSGLPLRSGLARVATWGWMFKAYTQRDWAIFTQTYGQPLRIGKWGPGASEDDKNTLFRAVADIAGDCAAIIPETMSIDFVETGNVGASSDLYLKRADWLDRQMSKAVLGQTATTDAIAGGHAVGKEHRNVQEDIERADAKALAGILNRDLVQPWMKLNWGELKAYPRIRIGRPEPEDLEQLTSSLGVLIPLGMRVSEAEVMAKLNLKTPKAGEAILGATAPAAPVGGSPLQPASGAPAFERSGSIFERATTSGREFSDTRSLNASEAPQRAAERTGLKADIVAQIDEQVGPAVAVMAERIEAMVQAAGSLEELREMILSGFDDLDESALADLIGRAMVAAMAGARAEVAEGA
jgi:phage gp29-like protein